MNCSILVSQLELSLESAIVEILSTIASRVPQWPQFNEELLKTLDRSAVH